jgi:hypothetical protein
VDVFILSAMRADTFALKARDDKKSSNPKRCLDRRHLSVLDRDIACFSIQISIDGNWHAFSSDFAMLRLCRQWLTASLRSRVAGLVAELNHIVPFADKR